MVIEFGSLSLRRYKILKWLFNAAIFSVQGMGD